MQEAMNMRKPAGNTAKKEPYKLEPDSQSSSARLARLTSLLMKRGGTDNLASGDVIISKRPSFMGIDPREARCRIIVKKAGDTIVCEVSGRAFNDFKDHVEDVAPSAKCNSLPIQNTISRSTAPAARSPR